MAANGERGGDDDDGGDGGGGGGGGGGVVAPRAAPMQAVRLLRIVLVDYSAIRRTKLVPYCARSRGAPNALFVKGGLLLTAEGSLPPHAPLSAVGEVYMLRYSPYTHAAPPHHSAPQLPAPRVIAWPTHANHSLCVAHLHERNGQPWLFCPRQRLCRAVQLLAAHDLTMLAGFEMEFVLLRGHPSDARSLEPFGTAGGYALHSQVDAAARVLDHMVAALAHARIGVSMVHAESAAGQFEIVLQHKPLLTAVDELVMAREIVRAVACSHSLYATFLPKYGDAGSGAHVHFSLAGHFGGSAKLYEQHVGMTPLAQQFVAGVLEALPWLGFLTNASCASYARLQPQRWVGVYKVWGIANKEAPLRLALDRSNVELKTLDALSNPYLAMAGVVAAGLNGVRASMQLPPPCQHDPHDVERSKRAERLPASLEESIDRFRDAATRGCVRDVLPDELVHSLLALKLHQVQCVKRHGLDALLKRLLTLH